MLHVTLGIVVLALAAVAAIAATAICCCFRRCCKWRRRGDGDYERSLLAEAGEAGAIHGGAAVWEELYEARAARRAADDARCHSEAALDAARNELAELRCLLREANIGVVAIEAELDGVRGELEAMPTVGTLDEGNGDDLAVSLAGTRDVKRAVQEWEVKLTTVRSSLGGRTASGHGSDGGSTVALDPSKRVEVVPEVELDEVLAGLQRARSSLEGLEDMRVAMEAERDALKAERNSLEGVRKSLEGRLKRVSVGSSSLEKAMRTEADTLIEDVGRCRAAASSLRDGAAALLSWETEGAHWQAPLENVAALGDCFDGVRSALQVAGTQLRQLLDRLLAMKTLQLGQLPRDAASLEAFIFKHMGQNPQGVMALADWGSVRGGMLLAKVNGKPVPPGIVLSRLTKGQPFELRSGAILTFVRQPPPLVLPHVEGLLEDLSPVRELLRLRDDNFLPPQGPPLSVSSESTSLVDSQCLDAKILSAWEARLRWDAELAMFERQVWNELPTIGELCKQREEALGFVGSGAGLCTAGSGDSRSLPHCGTGKGKSKAKGPPPPRSKGADPTSTGNEQIKGPPPPDKGADPGSTGKNRTKGPPPPPGKGAVLTGKNSPPNAGKGPPIPKGGQGKGKGAKAGGVGKSVPTTTPGESKAAVEASDVSDAVRQKAMLRRGERLFGKQTRWPDAAMLSSQRRMFPTYISRCVDGDGVACIGDAFGERGRLLLHACIVERPKGTVSPLPPSSGEKGENGDQETPQELVQFVRGERGAMGDKRRMEAEIRFRRLAACRNSCAGRGLVVTPAAACQATHAVAACIAGLDFEGLAQRASNTALDVDAFLPAVEIAETEEEDKAESEKINQAFLLPPERAALLDYAAGCPACCQLSNGNAVERLSLLERKILPLAYVPGFSEKVKLYRIFASHAALEKEATTSFKLVDEACAAVRNSKLLLDLLAVTLQIASYVKNFGDSGVQDEGFALLKLPAYLSFRIGKYPFLLVLCAFLMNLKPRDRTRLWNGSDGPGAVAVAAESRPRVCSVSSISSATSPGGGAGSAGTKLSSPKRRSRPDGVLPRKDADKENGGAGQPRLRKGPSFAEKLEGELACARAVLRAGLTMQTLEAPLNQLDRMVRFVERCLREETKLFLPARPEQTSVPSPEEHAAELEAWSGGRRRLQQLLSELFEAKSRLRSRAAEMHVAERRLLEFAALREEEIKTASYVDVLKCVLDFVDQFRQTWAKLEANPVELESLQMVLLSASPLQMMFGSSCLEDAFNLWFARASAQSQSFRIWDEEAKYAALRSLFALFDANADGAIDAEEFRVTLRAIGVGLPESSQMHYELVEAYDSDGQGLMGFSDFRVLVEDRIRTAFRLFLSAAGGHAGTSTRDGICEADLQRIGERLGCSGLPKETYQKMIRVLDTGTCDTGMITVEAADFERLVLMQPDWDVGRVSSGHFLNRAASLSASRQRAQRHFVWADPSSINDGSGSGIEEADETQIEGLQVEAQTEELLSPGDRTAEPTTSERGEPCDIKLALPSQADPTTSDLGEPGDITSAELSML